MFIKLHNKKGVPTLVNIDHVNYMVTTDTVGTIIAFNAESQNRVQNVSETTEEIWAILERNKEVIK